VEFKGGEPVAARLWADGPVLAEPTAYQGLFEAAHGRTEAQGTREMAGPAQVR
jgi:hypothetical protein